MASDRPSIPPSPNPGGKSGGRTSPVLVPQGTLEGQPEIPLNRPVTTVGSNESARLHLLSRTVSKGHAIFVNSGGATYVADLASRTGTLVNGKSVRDAELKNGDRVQIGKFVFRYRMPANLGSAVSPIDAPPAAVIVVGWPALPVPGRAVSIGRGERSDISLSDDSSVSAPHAAIFQVDGQWAIRDMGSRTGTHVNGKAIQQQILNFGDRVTIGSSTILFQPGASVEDEFLGSEPVAADEEFSETTAAEPLEEIAPAAQVEEEQIPLADEEVSPVNDWKAAFPPSAAEPIEAPAEAVEAGEMHETAPVEEPTIYSDSIEPDAISIANGTKSEAVDWSAIAAVDLPEADGTIDEPAADIAAEIPLADETKSDAVDWSEIAAVDLAEPDISTEVPANIQAEIPLADEIPTKATDWNVSANEVAEVDPPATKAVAIEPAISIAVEASQSQRSISEVVATTIAFVGKPITVTPESAIETVVDVAEPAIQATDYSINSSEISVALSPAEEIADLEVTALAPPSPELPQAQVAQAAIPLIEESTPDAIDWNAISTADLAAEDHVETEAEAIEPEHLVADEFPTGGANWNATIAADLPVESHVVDEWSLEEVVESGAVAVEEAPEVEESFEEIEPLAAVSDEPTDMLAQDHLVEIEPLAVEPAPLVDQSHIDLVQKSVEWTATPAVNLPLEMIPLAVEEPNADVAKLALETPPTPTVDPHAPLEEFVFVPADVPVDPDAIPEVLFWGDPELDPVVAPEAEIVELSPEPAVAAAEQILEQEGITLPADLAAFAAASAVTAVSYGDAAPGFLAAAEQLALPASETAKSAAENLPAFIDVAAEPAPELIDPVDLDFLDTEIETNDSHESAIGWTALVDQDEPAGDEHITLSENSTVEPHAEIAELGEADLDFLDFGEETPEPTPPPSDESPAIEAEAPAPIPLDESPKLPAASSGPAHGPSIFGIQFEGGSFLGGMPISLHQPETVTPPVSSTFFDAKKTAPSGLEKVAALPVSVPPVIAPVAAPPEPATPIVARSNRPITPPRPTLASPGAALAPTSLTGLVSEARTPWSAAPVIPPTVRSDAAKGPGRVRQRMTTAFSAPGAAPRTAEVFSQLAAPIGVEVFGGKPGNPDQFSVPDSKETAAELAAAIVAEAPVVAPVTTPKKRRKSRLPWLVSLFVAIPAGLWTTIYVCPPISSRLLSAKMMGSLTFDGLTNLGAIDGLNFKKEQEKRLLFNSEDIRLRAQTILEKNNQPSGFIANADDYGKTVDNQYLNWSGNSLQFTYNTSDIDAGSAQVNAVLTALAEKDHDLDDAKNRARVAANSAQAAADDTAAKIQTLSEQRRTLLDQAQDTPDLSTVSDGDQEAVALTKKWNDAKDVRQNSEAVLADLRSQDMSKPIDIQADPQVVDLKKRLDPLNEQIARLKGINAISAGSTAVAGTNISEGATTQPADIDPLLAPLQQQADLLNKKLEQRRAELAPDAAMSPAQREVNMAARIENLSVKITALQKAENDAKTAADAANAKAAQNHAKMSAARLAGVKADELYTQLTQATADHKYAVQTQSDEEAALANCVTVAKMPSEPLVPISITDLRRPIAAGTSALSCFILGMMIAGELRRPKLMVAGVKPAAAPLVHPPARVIPWPEPAELNGLDSDNDQPPVVGEPDQIFGGV